MADLSPVETPAETGSGIAVRVENVSKTYALWASPSARLQYSMMSLARSVCPRGSRLRDRLQGRINRMSRPFKALEPLSFEIRKGESWGIIGVNGSGKSTLLKMISGNLQPSTGQIEVDGKVAILDYSSGLHGGFTGRENVYLKAATHGMSRQQIDERFDSITAFADIGDFIDQPVKTYSSGMQARLGFAIIAHVDADIIITDEALAVGDAFFVQKCMNFIRNFLKRGTFLFVSHSTNDVVSLCQNAIWLEHGKVREMGKAKDVAGHYLAQNALRLSQTYEELEQSSSEVSETHKTADPTATRIEQPALALARDYKAPSKIRDRRQELLSQTQWRNDLEIPVFDTNVSDYGTGGATIESVTIEDENGAPYTTIVGGEMVRVRIHVRASRDLVSPIVGFQVLDRLGQVLFGDNTYISTVNTPLKISAGETFGGTFYFQMPLLPVGEFGIRAAVARGSESAGSMMHVIDTALVVRSVSSSVRYGLVGIPMQYIELYKGESGS